MKNNIIILIINFIALLLVILITIRTIKISNDWEDLAYKAININRVLYQEIDKCIGDWKFTDEYNK